MLPIKANVSFRPKATSRALSPVPKNVKLPSPKEVREKGLLLGKKNDRGKYYLFGYFVYLVYDTIVHEMGSKKVFDAKVSMGAIAFEKT